MENQNEKLLQKLREKEEDLVQAGHYGKSLLDTIAHLEESLQQTNLEYEKKLENLEQYKHSLEMKVEAFKINENQMKINYSDEKRLLVVDHQKELKMQHKIHQETLSELTEKFTTTRQELDETNLLNEQLNNKITQQHECMADLQAALRKKTSSGSTSSSVSEMEAIWNENLALNEELIEVKSLCNEQQCEVEHLKFKNEELEQTHEYFNEEKQRLQEEVRQYSNNLEEIQVENANLSNELESLRSQPTDPTSRGNSLFAEVDDKRQLAEKNLISCQVKFKCMEKKYTQQVNYAMKLKSQIAQLLQTGGRHADRERISRLEQALACSQCDIKARNEKIKDLEKKISMNLDDKINDMKKSENPNADFVEFLEKLLKKKDAEITKLNKELQKCHIDLLAESRRVSDADRDVYSAQSERDNFKAQIIKLKMEVTRLKLKTGEEVQGKKSIRAGKTEKIPINTESRLTEIDENARPADVRDSADSLKKDAATALQKKSDCAVKTKSAGQCITEAPADCKQQ